MKMNRIGFVLFFVFLVGCASYIPDEEIILAEVAVKAARMVNAPVYAPRNFQLAAEALRKAKRARREREFELARRLALRARRYAELAENKAVLQKERGE